MIGDRHKAVLASGRVFASWLLTLVFALNILAASALSGVKKASHRGAGEFLTVLCTPTGPKLVKASSETAPIPDEKAASESCDFCLPFSKLVLPAPKQKPVLLALDLAIAPLHFPVIDSEGGSIALSKPLQPRAPPAFSA